jgi:hypothetical protein
MFWKIVVKVSTCLISHKSLGSCWQLSICVGWESKHGKKVSQQVRCMSRKSPHFQKFDSLHLILVSVSVRDQVFWPPLISQYWLIVLKFHESLSTGWFFQNVNSLSLILTIETSMPSKILLEMFLTGDNKRNESNQLSPWKPQKKVLQNFLFDPLNGKVTTKTQQT